MKFGLIVAAAVLVSAPAFAQDAANGEKIFKKCVACHAVGEGAKNKVGPQLNGVVGAPIGHEPTFKYSAAIQARHDAGEVWSEENLTAWLRNPKEFAKGTKMAFAGLKKDEEIADVIAYLKQFPATGG